MEERTPENILKKWTRLNTEISEHQILETMYLAGGAATTPLDKFSNWLLAGTGATGALMISQVDTVLPYLSDRGFKVCMGLLLVSALFGFGAKRQALVNQSGLITRDLAEKLAKPVHTDHKLEGEVIQEAAKQHKLDVDTEMDMGRIMKDFDAPLPRWAKLMVKRNLEKIQNDGVPGNSVFFVGMLSQSIWTYLQFINYILFMLAGAWFASDI